jgi:general secretion pathway protein L
MTMDAYRTRSRDLLRNMADAARAFVTEIAAADIFAHPPRLSFRVQPLSADAVTEEGSQPELVMTAAGRPQEAIRSLVERLGSLPGKECTVVFAHELAVVSRLILPAERSEIIEAIVRNKVESIAPWPLSQSLYGLRIAAVPGDPAHVAVDVGVVSCALFEDIAGVLGAAGALVTAASIRLAGGEGLDITVGWKQERAGALRRATRLAGGFAALAALVSGIGLLLVWQSASRLAADRADIAALMVSVQPNSYASAATQLQAANRLHERRRERPPAVALLNELSTLLPPNVWLISLSLDDLRLEIKGQGSDIPFLIEILEQSESFQDVNFTSATQLNEDLNSETFSIGATLEPAVTQSVP